MIISVVLSSVPLGIMAVGFLVGWAHRRRLAAGWMLLAAWLADYTVATHTKLARPNS